MKKTCDIDPCNIHFLMDFKEVLLSTWTKISTHHYYMAPFFNPGKKLLSDLSSNLPNRTGNSKTIDPSVTYCSSPNQLKRPPFFNFLILWGSELITYLPKCPLQTPFNRNCSIKHMCWNPTKSWTQQINSHGMSWPQCSIWHCQPHNIKNSHRTLCWSKNTSLQWLSSYVS